MQLWRRNFRFVWLNNCITAIGMMAFLPLFPLHLRELGITGAEARIWSGVLFAGAPLVAAFFSPFWGALGDRVGRRIMMVRSNVAIALCVALMAWADSPWTLLLLRILQGMGSGFIAPSLTLVSVSAPAGEQGRVAGLLHTAVLAGGVMGPLLGGWIGDVHSFRAVFVVCASLNVVALFVTLAYVREPTAERGEGPAPAQRALSWRDLGFKVFRDVGALLSAGPLRSVLVSVFAVRLGIGLVEPVLALFVESMPDASETALATMAGLVAGAAWIPPLLLCTWLGRIGDRVGHGPLLLVCAAGGCVTYLAQAFADSLWVLYAFRFLSGAFVAGVFPAAYGLASSHSDVSTRGGAFGMTFSSLILANGLGACVGGALAAAVGLRLLFGVSAALMALAVVRLAVRARRERNVALQVR